MARWIEDTSFLFGPNSIFVEDLYTRYLADPNSVDESWRRVFAELGDDPQAVADETRWAHRRLPRSFAPRTAKRYTKQRGASP